MTKKKILFFSQPTFKNIHTLPERKFPVKDRGLNFYYQ